jgi:predicted nucleic acid-binding protein
MDDAKALSIAERYDIRVFGTLGILEAAALRDFVDLQAALKKLGHTNFRAKPALFDSLLKRHRG